MYASINLCFLILDATWPSSSCLKSSPWWAIHLNYEADKPFLSEVAFVVCCFIQQYKINSKHAKLAFDVFTHFTNVHRRQIFAKHWNKLSKNTVNLETCRGYNQVTEPIFKDAGTFNTVTAIHPKAEFYKLRLRTQSCWTEKESGKGSQLTDELSCEG